MRTTKSLHFTRKMRLFEKKYEPIMSREVGGGTPPPPAFGSATTRHKSTGHLKHAVAYCHYFPVALKPFFERGLEIRPIICTWYVDFHHTPWNRAWWHKNKRHVQFLTSAPNFRGNRVSWPLAQPSLSPCYFLCFFLNVCFAANSFWRRVISTK